MAGDDARWMIRLPFSSPRETVQHHQNWDMLTRWINKLPIAQIMKRQLTTFQRITSSTQTAITSHVPVDDASVTFTAEAGRIYRVFGRFMGTLSATGIAAITINEGVSTIAISRMTPTPAIVHQIEVDYWLFPTVTEQRTFWLGAAATGANLDLSVAPTTPVIVGVEDWGTAADASITLA